MKRLFIFLCAALIVFSVGSALWNAEQLWQGAYYTDSYYKQLEEMFNKSQYRVKNPIYIPDEVVFSYAAGAYIRGVDPILINSEHTPLGKYIIGLSVLAFKNDRIVVVPFFILTLIFLWMVSKEVLGDTLLALIPVLLFSTEKLFRNQLVYAPLLDILQLPFVLISLWLFIRSYKRRSFILLMVAVGITISVKTVVTGILLIGCFLFFLIVEKKWNRIISLVLHLPISGIVLLFSYTRTFLSGYTLIDFLGFQKWIFSYQNSKLIYPLSFWRLILMNRWQAWWGDKSVLRANDWNFLWPVIVIVPIGMALYALVVRKKLTPSVMVLLIYALSYEAFLSTGITSTRFFLPLLPVLYILSVYALRLFIEPKVRLKDAL